MYSGWVLMFYVFTHLLNHSLGIFSITILETGRDYFLAFWRTPILTWLVSFSILVHAGFVFRKLFFKHTFKGLQRSEWTQIILGLALPLLLIPHIYDTKLLSLIYELDDNYSYFLVSTFPKYLIILLIIILMAWSHGVIGIRSFASQKSWYRKHRNLFNTLATAMPIFAFWGVVSAGKEIVRLKSDPDWLSKLEGLSNPKNIDLVQIQDAFLATFAPSYLGILVLFFLLRYSFRKFRSHSGGVEIKYLDGKSIIVPMGTTILEASISQNIPHAHVCGGRGRCSTCRVQVIDGMEVLSLPTQDEKKLLKKVRAGLDVRLACKAVPRAACTVYPLLRPNVSMKEIAASPQNTGRDQEIAILFADLRGFTSISEEKLPYDVVFVLNQYFQSMGHAIEAHNGIIDKFIGDAIMALFGVEEGLEQGSINAIRAAKEMFHQLDRLNKRLEQELSQPLKMGIGIHGGPVIIGEMGYKNSKNLAAIGDATNTASRLESLTKEMQSELIISDVVAQTSGFNFSQYEQKEVLIRGRTHPLKIYCINNIREAEFKGAGRSMVEGSKD